MRYLKKFNEEIEVTDEKTELFNFCKLKCKNMKHLKTYNENKTMLLQKIEDIKLDLRDICLELSDQGFNIAVRNSLTDKEDYYMQYKNKKHGIPGVPGEDGIYTITIRSSGLFPYHKIKETVGRLNHYMSNIGFISWVPVKFHGYGVYFIQFTRKKSN